MNVKIAEMMVRYKPPYPLTDNQGKCEAYGYLRCHLAMWPLVEAMEKIATCDPISRQGDYQTRIAEHALAQYRRDVVGEK